MFASITTDSKTHTLCMGKRIKTMHCKICNNIINPTALRGHLFNNIINHLLCWEATTAIPNGFLEQLMLFLNLKRGIALFP